MTQLIVGGQGVGAHGARERECLLGQVQFHGRRLTPKLSVVVEQVPQRAEMGGLILDGLHKGGVTAQPD